MKIISSKHISIILVYLIIIIVPLLPPHNILDTLDHVDILCLLLDHLHPLPPHLHHCLEWIQHLHPRVVIILDQFVHTNECPSPSNPSTTVNNYWYICAEIISS